jgi:ATP-binding cassette subfamily C protein CydC
MSQAQALLRPLIRRHAGALAFAAAGAALAATAATLLLGVSGWFLAGAGFAGAAGPLAVQAFNYLLPSAGFRALAIVRTAGRYGERIWSHEAALKVLAGLRPALFLLIAAAPSRQALGLSSGEASARVVQDVDLLETAIVRRPAPWAAAAGLGAGLATTGLVSALAALAFCAGYAGLLAASRWLSPRWLAGPVKVRQEAVGALKDAVSAYAAASAELRSFGLTEPARAAIRARDAQAGEAALKTAEAEAALGLAQALLTALTVLSVALAVQNAAPPLAALAVLGALAGLETAGGLTRAAEQAPGLKAGLARLDEWAAPLKASAPPGRAGDQLALFGQVLQPGTRLVLQAPSGGGKSTLIEAMVGLRAPPPGVITVGGQPLEHLAEGAARDLFAWAAQDSRAISGSVADNLRLAAPKLSDEALWAALETAQLADRVRRAPGGLGAWVGDGGDLLSGGERRRLAIARALLRDAPWLVLDEPSEGLDPATEAALVAALGAHLDRTGQGLILASHRPGMRALATQEITLQPGWLARHAT